MPSQKRATNKPRIGVVIYTHNRTDDARISMEIIRSLWATSGLFGRITITHVFNGRQSWWPTQYLEDILIRRKNLGHFAGAADMIDTGMKRLLTDRQIDNIVLLAADTWLVKPHALRAIIDRMKKRNGTWATAAWGNPKRNDIVDVGCSMDFAIFSRPWIRRYRMFPLRYVEFANKYRDLYFYQKGHMVSVEKLAFGRYLEAFQRSAPQPDVALRRRAVKQIVRLVEREPVHRNSRWDRTMYWPRLGLLSHHQPQQKQRLLKSSRLSLGPTATRLIQSKSLNWYNHGLTS